MDLDQGRCVPAPPMTESPFAPLPDLRLGVLQAAGGDPAFAAALRQILWDGYCHAGRPFGPDEDGMWTWWAYGERTTAQ